jgi:hypothetical protein
VTHLLAELAAAECGTREESPNSGRRVRLYQSATHLRPAPWPWCSAFVCYIVRQWIERQEVADWLGLRSTTPEAWRPKTALAFGLLSWARARPRTCRQLGDSDRAAAGDIVVYSFSHCGIVLADIDGGLLSVAEGNTNPEGSREGDGVYRKIRSRNSVVSFIRFNPAS